MTTILIKEILQHARSAQFLLLSVISTVLYLVCGAYSGEIYSERLAWYTFKSLDTEQHPSTVSRDLCMKPAGLSFVAEGGEGSLPPGYTLDQKGFLRPLAARPGNFKLPPVPALDWSFIVRFVFSLYVILLGFDAIAGEKVDGTLRLMLAGPLGRARLLAAKYAAIMSAVAIPLLCGMLCSLLITARTSPAALTGDTIAAAALSFLPGIFYLSLFAFLSLFLSSLLRQPSLVLLTLLLAWVLFTVIVPSAAGIIAEGTTSVPREYTIARELEPTIQKEVWHKIGEISDRADRGEIADENALRQETDKAFEAGQERLRGYYESFERAVRQRADAVRAFSRITPAALFQYAQEEIAGTGLTHEARFLRDAREYSREYDAYVLRKTGTLIGSSYWSFGTMIGLRGKNVFITSPRAVEYRGDQSDCPRFVEAPRSVSDGIRAALLDASGLLAWNIVLAMLAFGTILRMDVR